ncbi:MAG: hypothetical protein A4S12_00645 [Proteobacteria bacterium SG_bin5]|nr:MAG: hypothetical protein A4S12_00645 [Proteobacteria bacterium SG_bin5]
MAKKTSLSRPEKTPAKAGTQLVPAPAAPAHSLAPLTDVGIGSVVSEKGVTMVIGQPYPIGDRSVLADAVYYVGGRIDGRGGRLGGADKIAWRDPASGYECIIMRDTRGGYLSGYVGVPVEHPLYGFDHDAIPPELELEVHGGLSYSAVCDEGPSPERRRLADEARTICHVPARPPRYASIEHATDYRAAHDGAWWFGFDCNQVYDIVPWEREDRSRFLGQETGATFKDEAYVYDQVIDLAAQLKAIADGKPKPARTGTPPPPLGLDPKKGG